MWTTGALSVFNDNWADHFTEESASPSNQITEQQNRQGTTAGQVSPGGTEYLNLPDGDVAMGAELDEWMAQTSTANHDTNLVTPLDQNHQIPDPVDQHDTNVFHPDTHAIDPNYTGDTQMNFVQDFSMDASLNPSHLGWPMDSLPPSQADAAQFSNQISLLDFDVEQYISQNPNLFQEQLPGPFAPLSPALTPPPVSSVKFSASSNLDATPAASSSSFSARQFENKPAFDTDDQRWEATLSRSHAADRSFLYGVTTTKIFCRPSCPSRRATRRNVQFFPFPGAIETAISADFRPCKRCKPETIGTVDTGVLGVIKVLGLIINDATSPFTPEETSTKLETLAEAGGLSAFHFHRLFKATTKLTPGELIAACRSLALGDALGLDNNKNIKQQNQSEGSRRASTTEDPSPSATTLIANSTKWNPRTARKALGSVSPTDYVAGCRSLKTQRITADTTQGLTSIAYSPHRGDILAVLLGPDAEDRLGIRFPGIITSETRAHSLEKCIRDLQEAGSDREDDIPEEFKSWLWRARVWVRVVRDAVLKDDEN